MFMLGLTAVGSAGAPAGFPKTLFAAPGVASGFGAVGGLFSAAPKRFLDVVFFSNFGFA